MILTAKKSMGKCLSIVALLVLGLAQAAQADPAFDQGVRLYNQRNFKVAGDYFERSIKNAPWDANAYYYLALSYHQQGNFAKAKDRYRQIIAAFPNSPAAQLAITALQRLDPDLYRRMTSIGGQPAAAQVASDPTLPDQARVYFVRQDNGGLEVDAEVNNRGIKMVFDTGASSCAFGKNHLQQLGITPPTGEATGTAGGVGAGGIQKTWDMNVTLKVGQITRRNFPISVQENLPTEPLLGQTFFSDYAYVIDNGARSIVFTKKGSGVQANDRNAVPFTREGKEMVVNVEVNGRSCPMYFDTGADGVTFTHAQLKNVGVSVPEDAEKETSIGIAGETEGVAFNVDRMKLGPVEKTNIRVSVVEAAAMSKPLLGQNFFGDWQYTIDNQNRLIHFLRR